MKVKLKPSERVSTFVAAAVEKRLLELKQERIGLTKQESRKLTVINHLLKNWDEIIR